MCPQSGVRRPAPAVSVLLNVRNGERHLPAALESLARQTFTDFELVVVDDCSDDTTPQILDAARSQDSRVVVVRNDRPLGIPASLNLGLSHCRGALVAKSDHDDISHPDRLARQVAWMEAHPDIGVLGTGYRLIDDAGALLSIATVPTDPDLVHWRLVLMNSLLHPSVIYRRAVVEAAGGYDPAYWTASDSDLFVRLRDRTRLANLPDPLLDYRRHAGSITRTRGGDGERLSKTIPERTFADLLGRPVDGQAVADAVNLFHGGCPPAGRALRRGVALLCEVVAAIGRKAPAHVARALRREAARAVARQLPAHRRDPVTAAALMARILTLDPGLPMRPDTLRRLRARRLSQPSAEVSNARHTA